MSFLCSRVPAAFLLSCLMLTHAFGQKAQPRDALVKSIRVVPDGRGAAVEILSDGSITPTISKLQNPERLVIDLPNSVLLGIGHKIDFRSDQISSVRTSQFQNAPPVARIVLDLAKPVNFTWEGMGNRLVVHTQASTVIAEDTPTVPALTRGTPPLAVPVNSPSGGALMLAGSQITPGSSVSAGSDTAVLRLGRGGEVRVCPGTTLSVTSSRNGHSLMFGMSTGAFEAHYTLDTAADSILTPDFRIQLPGPGEFHYAISADSKGNTCVRALPGNSASVVVSELLSDATYQVKPSEQVIFHSGRLTNVSAEIPAECGCPPPSMPLMRASATLPISQKPVPPSISLTANARVKPVSAESPAAEPLPSGPETAPLPPSKPNDVHIEVEAPFVFRANDPPSGANAVPAIPPPAPVAQAALLPVQSRLALSQTAALPEALPPPRQRFLGRVRNFFAALFG
jgi:hypothetical protein